MFQPESVEKLDEPNRKLDDAKSGQKMGNQGKTRPFNFFHSRARNTSARRACKHICTKWLSVLERACSNASDRSALVTSIGI